jgi:hypothetical protein
MELHSPGCYGAPVQAHATAGAPTAVVRRRCLIMQLALVPCSFTSTVPRLHAALSRFSVLINSLYVTHDVPQTAAVVARRQEVVATAAACCSCVRTLVCLPPAAA